MMAAVNSLKQTFNKAFLFGDSSENAKCDKLAWKVGANGRRHWMFNMPSGIAVSRDGDIIIADTGNHRLLILGADHRLKQTISSRGCQPWQLNFPMGVALSHSEPQEIIVTDSVNAAVKAFRLNGEYIDRLNNDDSAFDFPHGIAVSSDNRFAVTDLIKHSVVILNQDGDIVNQFGCYGSQPNQLDHPYHVTISDNDQVLVSDTGNMAIKIFSMDGDLLQTFGTHHFRIPEDDDILLQGITSDNQGNTLVVGNSTVYAMASNGRLWEVIIPEDGLYSPKALTYTPEGYVLLTQYGIDDRHELYAFKYNSKDYISLSHVQQCKYAK